MDRDNLLLFICMFFSFISQNCEVSAPRMTLYGDKNIQNTLDFFNNKFVGQLRHDQLSLLMHFYMLA